MPTLKQLTCSVEWSDSGTPLQEHSTAYADGFVKTYIAVPSKPTPFSIRLRSNGYIAPGLAMFVFMDGVYQCNRNRHNLKIPDGMSKRGKTEVNFHVRQKEEIMPDGTFRAQEWRFQKVDVVSDPSDLKNIHVPQHAEFVGTIEVVVLRCLGTKASNETMINPHFNRSTFAAQAPNSSKSKWDNPRNTLGHPSDDDSWSSSSSASAVGGMFDGPCDYARKPTGTMLFGGDMAWDDLSPNQDQPQQWRSGSRVPGYGLGRSHSGGPEPNTSNRGPQHSGARDRSLDQSNQDCGHARSENKRSHNSPNLTNAEQNTNGAKSKPLSSIVPRHSPAGSAVNRNGSNAAADAPAVVININHGSRSRREPTWTEASEADSVIDSVPWQNVGQDDKNGQSQRGRKPSPNNSVEHEGSKKSSSEGGNWRAQPAYGGNGGDTGFSNPDNWGTAQPAMPGGWNASNDQDRANNAGWDNAKDQHQANNSNWDNDQNKNSTIWKATNERFHENDNNGNTNQNHNNVWDVQGKANADHWENSNTQGQGNNNHGWNAKHNGTAPGWDLFTHHNQGQNQPWKPNENCNTAQNNWTDNGGWNDRASNNHQNRNSGKPQEPAAQSWGGKDEDKRWAEPTQTDVSKTAAAPALGNGQSKRRFSGSDGFHSPFHVMPDPNQVNKSFSPHPGGNQSDPQTAWVESSTTVPRIARQQSSPPLETHNGPNAPRMESFPDVGLGLLPQDDFQPKPYWSSWKQPKDNDDRSKAFAPAFESVEPLCKVPSEIAQRNNTTHQIHIDQSRPYAHRKASPKYIDSQSDPYAVFIFKYRSKAMLEQILDTKLTETEAESRQRMHGMSKDELIEQILKVKGSAGSESTSASNQSIGSKNTLKGIHTTYDPNGHAANDVNLGAVNPELSHLHMHGKHSPRGSDQRPAHPDVRFSHDNHHNPPSWDRVPTASHHERVTGWLGSDHGAGGGGAAVRNAGSRNGANGGAGWTANSSGSVANMNTHTPAGGNGNWDGRANWTGQQGEGGGNHGNGNGNGNGDWISEHQHNIGIGGGQATGSWHGDGDGGTQW